MKSKTFFYLLLIFNAGVLFAQNPFENTTWKTDRMIGIENFKFSKNNQQIKLDTLSQKYPYGNIVTFNETTFLAYNQGPCGNECRIKVSGNYTINQNKISLFVTTISYAKDCAKKPIQSINQNIGTYIWQIDKQQILLTKK